MTNPFPLASEATFEKARTIADVDPAFVASVIEALNRPWRTNEFTREVKMNGIRFSDSNLVLVALIERGFDAYLPSGRQWIVEIRRPNEVKTASSTPA